MDLYFADSKKKGKDKMQILLDLKNTFVHFKYKRPDVEFVINAINERLEHEKANQNNHEHDLEESGFLSHAEVEGQGD